MWLKNKDYDEILNENKVIEEKREEIGKMEESKREDGRRESGNKSKYVNGGFVERIGGKLKRIDKIGKSGEGKKLGKKMEYLERGLKIRVMDEGKRGVDIESGDDIVEKIIKIDWRKGMGWDEDLKEIEKEDEVECKGEIIEEIIMKMRKERDEEKIREKKDKCLRNGENGVIGKDEMR